MKRHGISSKGILSVLATIVIGGWVAGVVLPRVVWSQSTIEINQSLMEESVKADKELERYFKRIEKHLKEEPETIKLLKASQEAWKSFRKMDCDAIYKHWEDGTIRVAMSRQHYIQLTRRRTHDLWAAYLTYMDSTPPLLEEPKIE